MIYTLYVLNRHGGVIFQKSFVCCSEEADSLNSMLQQGSTFFILSRMAQQVSPVDNSCGIQSIEFGDYVVECLATQTGLQFICVADQSHQRVRDLLACVYELYADYVAKNPFSLPDQPIKAEKWEQHLEDLMQAQNHPPATTTESVTLASRAALLTGF